MTRTPRPSPARSAARQVRQRDLHAMLQDREREMQSVLQQRVRQMPSDGPAEGLDETEHAEADYQEHIEVALIPMKGETLQRVREALVRRRDQGAAAAGASLRRSLHGLRRPARAARHEGAAVRVTSGILADLHRQRGAVNTQGRPAAPGRRRWCRPVQGSEGRHNRPVSSRTTRISTTIPRPPLGK
jgi:hypothetical protein